MSAVTLYLKNDAPSSVNFHVDASHSIRSEVDRIINQAAENRASDIHVEPHRNGVRLRFRIDGLLQPAGDLPIALKEKIAARFKILGGLDIGEKRRPQDGQFVWSHHGETFDLRISSMPSRFGEKIVIRLLRPLSGTMSFTGLGMDSATAADVHRACQMTTGLILVTGPTGSGKTTTLYSAIKAMNRSERNIVTVEDPIEYEIADVNQTQVHPEIGLSFAVALRSFLRQDPDVIMVGEIRDRETASIAIRAALTGHLVLSTLHTNDAPSAITRLMDMGVEPYLLGSCLRLVLAQRLLRKLCRHCTSDVIDDRRKTAKLPCSHCQGTGYSGRLGLFENMVVSPAMSDLISARATPSRIQTQAKQDGLVTMLDQGLALVAKGITLREEVLRTVTDA